MVIKRGRQGLVCASVGAMNVSDLRHITTGRIYIRPLQASLPIESDAGNEQLIAYIIVCNDYNMMQYLLIYCFNVLAIILLCRPITNKILCVQLFNAY
jgi:hypothetical protein